MGEILYLNKQEEKIVILPSHVAIIMDGNGRWAREQNLARKQGHKKGVKALKDIVEECGNQGIECLTVYAFSTENWKRPESEIEFLMRLFQETINSEAENLNKNNVKVKVIGRRKNLPEFLLDEIYQIENLTVNNDGLLFNLAFNYGGRAEIIDCVKNIIKKNDFSDIEEIDEDFFQKYLYNSSYPEVELLIRTGGEKRLSNFLLWESAYAELYLVDKYWPEFSKSDFRRAIEVFQSRNRKFGSIDK